MANKTTANISPKQKMALFVAAPFFGFLGGVIIGGIGGLGADLLELLQLVVVEECISCSPMEEVLFVRSYYAKGYYFTGAILGGAFSALAIVSLCFSGRKGENSE